MGQRQRFQKRKVRGLGWESEKTEKEHINKRGGRDVGREEARREGKVKDVIKGGRG